MYSADRTIDDVINSSSPAAAVTHVMSRAEADEVLASVNLKLLVVRVRASGGTGDISTITNELDNAGVNLLLGVAVDKRGELLVDRLRACLVRAVTGVIMEGFTFEREGL